MQVGVPKEIKDRENRVALTPNGAAALVAAGHRVVMESGAGNGSGYLDEEYRSRNVAITDAAEAWASELVVKIKEPLATEYDRLQGQIVFTYFHLAGVPASLTDALLNSGTTAIAYETVEDANGRLPLLAPMSAVAGTMAIPLGDYYLAMSNGGRGMLLGRVLGERFGKVVVIGDGVVGRHAAAAALGLGANVCLAGRRAERVAELQTELSDALRFVISTPENLATEIANADLLIGAVLIPGARAPRIVSKEMVASMPTGAVVVDVSIDQGGCIETARPTSHSDPVYVDCGVTHYCVTNMPGAYPRTATIALTNATLPYVMRLAADGLDALRADRGFAKGLNTYRGWITYAPVAAALALTAKFEASPLEL